MLEEQLGTHNIYKTQNLQHSAGIEPTSVPQHKNLVYRRFLWRQRKRRWRSLPVTLSITITFRSERLVSTYSPGWTILLFFCWSWGFIYIYESCNVWKSVFSFSVKFHVIWSRIGSQNNRERSKFTGFWNISFLTKTRLGQTTIIIDYFFAQNSDKTFFLTCSGNRIVVSDPICLRLIDHLIDMLLKFQWNLFRTIFYYTPIYSSKRLSTV